MQTDAEDAEEWTLATTGVHSKVDVRWKALRWSKIHYVPPSSVQPECTLAKALAFVSITHRRLGEKTVQLPQELVRMIVEFACGERRCYLTDKDSILRDRALRTLSLGRALSDPCRVWNNRQYPRHSADFHMFCYNVPFVTAAPLKNTRFRYDDNCTPDIKWLSRFMDMDSMPVILVNGVPTFTKCISGSKSCTSATRPAFAGCAIAAWVLHSTRVLTTNSKWCYGMMQTWWARHWELFDNGRRYFVQNKISNPLYTFFLFPVLNPEASSFLMHKMHRAVNAKMVKSWLEDLWGVYNVATYLRVRDVKDGVQIFLFASKALLVVDAVLQSEVFQTIVPMLPDGSTVIPL
tara:strand:+ start:4923 stop:5969 length:1047 start_codon:yes stop_codon:yes gene_type:complete